jgi:uncharacterized membrane protein
VPSATPSRAAISVIRRWSCQRSKAISRCRGGSSAMIAAALASAMAFSAAASVSAAVGW